MAPTKFYFAPMEGITQYTLRNTHRAMFGDETDKYYTPFLSAPKTRKFKKREKNDILPVNNDVFPDFTEKVVPQILANSADNFLWAAKEIASLGYKEINLNLGCPVATVVTKHKGSGLLADTDYLDDMLKKITEDELFSKTESDDASSFPKFSVKTRLGVTDESEADKLMEIFAKYPISELTIHARVQKDFYQGKPKTDAFKRAVEIYRGSGGTADICYNGDINSIDDYNRLIDNMSSLGAVGNNDNSCGISAVMMGRGMLRTPALARDLSIGSPTLSKEELKQYLQKLYLGYETFIHEDRNVIFKMLEHWAFINSHFENSDKCLKAIRKARSKGEYLAAVRNIFSTCNFIA
ncbi:tRNA dihydrouridine synthase [Butyrivibrio sp. X503]|uniref:tRNA dihydrouridine synthase n=1 Tax=Butyrivibrio sp. X503 TaxID=2364878 RepID=UPI00131468D4|nr:tRNA-dihydrouridine synthase family protein [Butyrivibrio sp. X503]